MHGENKSSPPHQWGEHLLPLVDKEQEEQPVLWEQELTAPSTNVPHIALGSKGKVSQPTCGGLLGEEVPPSPAEADKIEQKRLDNDEKF